MEEEIRLGGKLRELRKEKNLNQKELATILSVDRSLIAKYESDKALPSIPMLRKLAVFFGVSSDYLIDLDKFG